MVQGGESSGELFTIYLNDLPGQVNEGTPATKVEDSTADEFIDDVTLVSRAETDQALKIKLQEDYKALHNYLINHLMVVNTSKTQLMMINPPKDEPPPFISIEGSIITHQDEMKILGITLTPDLKMDHHIWAGKKSLINIINTKTALIRNIKPYLTQKQLSVVGGALVNSSILYGAPIWGVTTQQNIEIVQKYQTRAARTITNKGWIQASTKRSHRQTLLDELGWKNTNQIVSASILNLTKSAMDLNSAKSVNQMFKITKPNNPRKGQGARINLKGKIGQKGNTFGTKAPQLFNQLPADLRNTEISATKFKKEIKTYISTQYKLVEH